jgi:hypothetical protein
MILLVRGRVLPLNGLKVPKMVEIFKHKIVDNEKFYVIWWNLWSCCKPFSQ